MSFDPASKLDPSQVVDRRGVSGRTAAIGGGGLGIVGLIVALVVVFAGGGGSGNSVVDVLNQLSGLNGQQAGGPGAPGPPGAPGKVASECRTGADAERTQDCRIVGYVNSIQAYWEKAVRGYKVVPTVFFTGHTQTGCGPASSPGGSVRLPSRPARLHRSGVLPGASDAVRRERRSVCRGLRSGPRIRASRAEPAGNPEDGQRRAGS